MFIPMKIVHEAKTIYFPGRKMSLALWVHRAATLLTPTSLAANFWFSAWLILIGKIKINSSCSLSRLHKLLNAPKKYICNVMVTPASRPGESHYFVIPWFDHCVKLASQFGCLSVWGFRQTLTSQLAN